MQLLGVSSLWFKPVGETEWKEVKGVKIDTSSMQPYCGVPVLDTKRSYSLSFDIDVRVPKFNLSRAQKRHLRRKYGRKYWRQCYFHSDTLKMIYLTKTRLWRSKHRI